jgi:hypothetical protein
MEWIYAGSSWRHVSQVPLKLTDVAKGATRFLPSADLRPLAGVDYNVTLRSVTARLIDRRTAQTPEALTLRVMRRTLLWACTALACAAIAFGALIFWPDPLFAFSLRAGKIIVASDRPIPTAGGERFLHDCERLLERSPLKAHGGQYRLYVTNANWRQRLFSAWGLAYAYPYGGSDFLSGANFATGRVVHWGYVGTPPRTLAWLCAHELTHIVTGEHVGLRRFFIPERVWEGFADYVGIENRESFEELRDALGDRPVDIPMMQRYGSYPRYRLLVTYFIEKKGWTRASFWKRD